MDEIDVLEIAEALDGALYEFIMICEWLEYIEPQREAEAAALAVATTVAAVVDEKTKNLRRPT
jgi:hypothetical protein